MDRTTRNLFAIILVAVIALTGGAALVLSGTSGIGPAGSGTGGLGPSGEPNLPTATGVITAVDSAGLGNVRSFTIREVDGTMRAFALSKLENGVQFPPGHLSEHLANARPVKVWYRNEAGTLFAIWLEDAP